MLLGILLGGGANANDYIAPNVCGECHAEIARAYAQTAMAHSAFRPSLPNTIEDYRGRNKFFHSVSLTEYEMIARGGAYYQRRWQTGFDGAETNVEELRIDLVIGSGAHARSYLHRTPAGGYIELPLGWYAEKGGLWAMSPGFNTSHPETRRFVSYQCVFCHDAYPKIPAAADAPATPPTFAANLPDGIDCQRCHGPGADHVHAARAASPPARTRAAIVNPARLPSQRQLDVCEQCHLQPTSGPLVALMRRFDRAPFSYRPGEPLADFEAVFDNSNAAKFEIVNASAYRLRKSACFLQSNGALTCTTCHDPHGLKPASYSESCRGCHASAIDSAVAAGGHPASADCVACHMLKRRTEDVVHVVMTDHWIQRRPSIASPLADLPERRDDALPHNVTEYRHDPSAPGHADDPLYLAIARQSPEELARELARLRPRQPAFYAALGRLWQDHGNPSQAAAAFEQAVDFVSAAQAFELLSNWPRVAELLARAIRATPESSLAWFESGKVDLELGRTAQSIANMEKAVALDGDSAGAHAGLAETLHRSGQPGPAERELRISLGIDPYEASAYDLLGRLLAERAAAAESIFDFRQATRLRPGYAPHLYDYALELYSVRRFTESRAAVEAAIQSDPEMAEAHLLLGSLLAAAGDLAQATAHLTQAAASQKPDVSRAATELLQRIAK